MTSQATRLQLINAVKAVRAVEGARKRVPDALHNVSFFSALDMWFYVGQYDPETQCDYCRSFDGNFYLGSELRSRFPDLQIESEDLIWVNYHQTLWGVDTCKCYLTRVKDTTDVAYKLGQGAQIIYGEET
jgi:hypothetical protein